MDLHRADMEGLIGLTDNFVVINDSAVFGHDFRDGILKVPARADEGLDDRHRASGVSDDEIARMRPHSIAVTDEEQVNESVQQDAPGHLDQRAILHLRRVESGHR